MSGSTLLSLGMRGIDTALSLLFGLECGVCGGPIDTGSLCGECMKLSPLEPPFCRSCGHPVSHEIERCGRCPQSIAVTAIRSGYWFEGPGRSAWLGIKFGHRHEYLTQLRRSVQACLARPPFPRLQSAIVIPVPLPFARFYRRGLNQSEWLARTFSRELDYPLDSNGLVRDGEGRPQSLLSATGRRRNLKGALRWRRKTKVPARVILVDDVVTSGSTLRECARVLKKAGVEEVYAWTFYRTPLRGPVNVTISQR